MEISSVVETIFLWACVKVKWQGYTVVRQSGSIIGCYPLAVSLSQLAA